MIGSLGFKNGAVMRPEADKFFRCLTPAQFELINNDPEVQFPLLVASHSFCAFLFYSCRRRRDSMRCAFLALQRFALLHELTPERNHCRRGAMRSQVLDKLDGHLGPEHRDGLQEQIATLREKSKAQARKNWHVLKAMTNVVDGAFT